MLRAHLAYFDGRYRMAFGCGLWDYLPDDSAGWWAVAWAMVIEAAEAGHLERMGRVDHRFRWGGPTVWLRKTWGDNPDNDEAIAAWTAMIPPAERAD